MGRDSPFRRFTELSEFNPTISTSPSLFKELQDELQIGKPASKLIPIPQLADTIKQLRAQERKIVFTNGCFDILHKGHVCYLEKAKRLGDVLS